MSYALKKKNVWLQALNLTFIDGLVSIANTLILVICYRSHWSRWWCHGCEVEVIHLSWLGEKSFNFRSCGNLYFPVVEVVRAKPSTCCSCERSFRWPIFMVMRLSRVRSYKSVVVVRLKSPCCHDCEDKATPMLSMWGKKSSNCCFCERRCLNLWLKGSRQTIMIEGEVVLLLELQVLSSSYGCEGKSSTHYIYGCEGRSTTCYDYNIKSFNFNGYDGGLPTADDTEIT